MLGDDGGTRHSLEAIVQQYKEGGDVPRLLDQLSGMAAVASTPALIDAVQPYRDMHEVAGPLYEIIVEREPNNAAALVALGNAFWLTGRGPEVVGELASRALASDPSNRAAWHLWALTESSPRQRMKRWRQVSERFPTGDLARASLADNAASVAGSENDPVALNLAIASYEALLATATQASQVAALESALNTLRNWTV